jgi:predicted porin
MNKKLIAMAVAAAFAAPAAMAEVTLYGKAHVDVRFGETEDTVNSNSSRLGFKGAEDLGNGLKALFKYEVSYDITDGAAFGGARDSYVGLSSNEYGSLLVGRMASPNKAALYAAGNVHLADSIADFADDYASKHNWSNSATSNATTVNTTGKGRTSNAIAYFSPSMNGLQLIAAMVPNETNNDDGIADYYGFAVTYGGNGLKAAAGMTSNSDQDIDVYNLGASYTFNNVTIGAQYENEEVGTNEMDAVGVSAKASFGNNAIIGSYTTADVNSVDTDDIRLALQHSMSKRTSVYVAYHNEDTDGGTDNDEFALGMIHSF